jgi:hypothetical protein
LPPSQAKSNLASSLGFPTADLRFAVLALASALQWLLETGW